jgi:hypothetical protein
MTDEAKQIIFHILSFIFSPNMVGVAQLVRAPGCGPGGRGFEAHRSPHFWTVMNDEL